MTIPPPAQDLLTLAEMHAYLGTGDLPASLPPRALRCLEDRTRQRRHPIPRPAGAHPVTDLLTWEELAALAAAGEVPADFADRVARIIADERCCNCGGVRCMECLMRHRHATCVDDCPHCCG